MGQRTSDYPIFILDPDSVFPRISDQSDSLIPSKHTMDMKMSRLQSEGYTNIYVINH